MGRKQWGLASGSVDVEGAWMDLGETLEAIQKDLLMNEMQEEKRGNKGSSWDVGQTDREVFPRRKIMERKRIKSKVVVLF